MRGSRLQAASIFLRTATATARITLATLYEVYRGRFRRETGDARLRWWSRRLLELPRVHCKVFGDPSVVLAGGQPVVVMSNHASLYDIPLLFISLPGSLRMLTKKELFRVPVWGRGMAAAEFVAVDRSDHARAVRDLELAREKMADGIALWVAPEGTRSRDGSLGRFKKGGFVLALQTGARIVPVGIRGSRDILPPKTFVEVNLDQEVEVHVGEPIDASAYTMEERDELVALVRERIAGLLNGSTGAAIDGPIG